MIFSGDMFQYPPVGGHSLYIPLQIYGVGKEIELLQRLGRLAWKSVNTIISLTVQKRMEGDPEYVEAVN